jgi:hypothetical protein
MGPCPHGKMEQHGEPGEDWCAGPMSVLLEAWRPQLEFQMNAAPLGRVDDPCELRIGRLTEGELHTVQVLHDSLTNFKPLGWTSAWGERWYDVPTYNSVVDDLGFDPLWGPPNG